MRNVRTRAEAEKETYGQQGSVKFDPARCVEAVYPAEGGHWSAYQCQRKPVAGPDKLFCKQHDPAEVKRRGDERSAKWDADWEARKRGWALAASKTEAARILIDVAKWIAKNRKLAESDEWLSTIARDIAVNTYIQERLEAGD